MVFPPSEPEHEKSARGNSNYINYAHGDKEEPKKNKDYGSKATSNGIDDNVNSEDNDEEFENDETKNENEVEEEESEDSTDDEYCNNNEEREDGSGGSSSSNSKTSKRTSILTGSDLPQDSLKDDCLSKDSSKISKGSSNRKYSAYCLHNK